LRNFDVGWRARAAAGAEDGKVSERLANVQPGGSHIAAKGRTKQLAKSRLRRSQCRRAGRKSRWARPRLEIRQLGASTIDLEVRRRHVRRGRRFQELCELELGDLDRLTGGSKRLRR
jgi:hypothetical protein